ncbi:YhgE/Pip domain-containing protein [Mycolicibacillus parakoreensis]|uniref:YhgE/Pip domain-containing protein n=1 Tax=Mycolicibacillus parakoreensis TaxID=1069221 RepID=A0ABY3TYN9_9MYCO|nr:YhgE/Pip domain-containing protein [Mycolicibacillus parakoreensis]MCV7316574.1 YhgE/Pip domain-containing protein [Mycolicibacillus parakoreensis]ULN52793.1 YhgE/Pip domain-containing protein [Mycolicibacillus parakoreensis]HLR99971.1 YhgE/Pip domain-containing protein [Mycolicibacillus parakoreensis]
MTALRLALLEFRRFRRPQRWIVPVALALIPLLYGSLYLWSNWDPYGKTAEIPVAVVVQDEPAVANGQLIDAGGQFAEQLRASGKFQWHFTDADDADEGLRHGRYYFTITVPPDFSAKLASAENPTPQRASLDITLNDANNYLVGIIAQTARSELEEQINSAAHGAYARAVYGELTQVKQQLKIAAEGAHRLVDGTVLAQQGSAALTEGIDAVQAGSAAIGDGVAQVSTTSAAADAAITQVIDAVVALIPEDEPHLDGLKQALRAAENLLQALTTGAQRVTAGATQISTALGPLKSGSMTLQSGADQTNSGATELSDVIDGALHKIPDTSPQQTAAASDVLSSPVEISTENLNPAGVYGRGFTPFFFAIALWVVGVLAYLFFRPANLRAWAGRVSALTVAVGGWLPAAVVTAVGGLVLYGVVAAGLGLKPDHPLWLAGLLVLAAGSFMAIDHFLRVTFGVIGGGLSLALLIIQLTSCGGLYPIETMPAPFRVIHPLIPMTYVVDGLRVAVSGGLTGNLIRDILVLTGFLVVFLGATTLMLRRQRIWTIARLHPRIETG